MPRKRKPLKSGMRGPSKTGGHRRAKYQAWRTHINPNQLPPPKPMDWSSEEYKKPD